MPAFTQSRSQSFLKGTADEVARVALAFNDLNDNLSQLRLSHHVD